MKLNGISYLFSTGLISEYHDLWRKTDKWLQANGYNVVHLKRMRKWYSKDTLDFFRHIKSEMGFSGFLSVEIIFNLDVLKLDDLQDILSSIIQMGKILFVGKEQFDSNRSDPLEIKTAILNLPKEHPPKKTPKRYVNMFSGLIVDMNGKKFRINDKGWGRRLIPPSGKYVTFPLAVLEAVFNEYWREKTGCWLGYGKPAQTALKQQVSNIRMNTSTLGKSKYICLAEVNFLDGKNDNLTILTERELNESRYSRRYWDKHWAIQMKVNQDDFKRLRPIT